MKLFEQKNRTHIEPALHNENSYDYYDHSAREDVGAVRNVLNQWFEEYPPEEKNELKSRFKKTFSSAFYELFIFSVFKNQGFEIVIHPEVPNSRKRPDFLLKKGNVEFYLEAKEARDKTIKQEAEGKRKNQIYDTLNKIESPNFFLRIEELISKTEKQPSVRKIIPIIENDLRKICPDKVNEDILNLGYDSSPRLSFENEDLKLIISLIPKDSENRNTNCRPIGAYHMGTHWGGAEESIKSSFSKKANRYGKLEKPYIICINAKSSKFGGEYDVSNAVWGSLGISWSTDPKNKDEKVVRQRDGIFMGEKGPIFQNVSGVFITNVMEFNIHVSNCWLIKHPFSKSELDFNIFQLAFQYAENGKIIFNKGETIAKILNINANWLNG